jgi:hypothetical protein
VKLPVRVIYGTIGDEKLILAAVYVNAYHIKQAFIDNTRFITDEVVAEDVLQLGLISLIEYEREKERRRLIKIPVPANTRIVNGSTPLRRV